MYLDLPCSLPLKIHIVPVWDLCSFFYSIAIHLLWTRQTHTRKFICVRLTTSLFYFARTQCVCVCVHVSMSHSFLTLLLLYHWRPCKHPSLCNWTKKKNHSNYKCAVRWCVCVCMLCFMSSNSFGFYPMISFTVFDSLPNFSLSLSLLLQLYDKHKHRMPNGTFTSTDTYNRFIGHKIHMYGIQYIYWLRVNVNVLLLLPQFSSARKIAFDI